jgi:hypothetical protein
MLIREKTTTSMEIATLMEKIAFMEKVLIRDNTTSIEFLNKVPYYLWIMRQPYTAKSHISGKDMRRMVEMSLFTPGEEYYDYTIGGWLVNASEEDLTDWIMGAMKREDIIVIYFPLFHAVCNIDVRGGHPSRIMLIRPEQRSESYVQRVQRAVDKTLMVYY